MRIIKQGTPEHSATLSAEKGLAVCCDSCGRTLYRLTDAIWGDTTVAARLFEPVAEDVPVVMDGLAPLCTCLRSWFPFWFHALRSRVFAR